MAHDKGTFNFEKHSAAKDWMLESLYNMLKLFCVAVPKCAAICDHSGVFAAMCVGLAVVWRGWERSTVSKAGVRANFSGNK